MAESIKCKNKQIQKQMKNLEEYLMKDYDEEKVNSIIKENSLELISKLKNGDLSAVEVLKAFQCKALEITKRINCITEFIPEAQEWAEYCDTIPIEDRKPLHGLPMSIKENVDVQGMDSTLGLSKHLYNPAHKHSTVVEILIKNGAVPFCKTNVPQVLLSFCCSNPVYGTSLHPDDPSRTPGGSSGGEAALIASGGSIVGIGSDLAGSARVPANWSGCYGIKLTSTRVSSTGFKKGVQGLVGVSSCPGVMGRDAHITTLVSRTLIEAIELNLADASIVPIPWNETVFTNDRKLTFGYFEETSYFPCTPGVKRAVREAKDALQKSGHKVIPFDMIDLESVASEVYKLVDADNGKNLREHLQNETIDPSIAKGMLLTTSIGIKKQILKKIIFFRSQMIGNMVKDDCYLTYDLWQSMKVRRKNMQEIKTRMKKDGIDLLLTPVYPLPAPQHYVPAIIVNACIYTVFANYCDFASGVVPVTRETENDQQLLEEYPMTDAILKIVKKATRGAIGLPNGVCLTGLSLEEELVLKGMQELESALNRSIT